MSRKGGGIFFTSGHFPIICVRAYATGVECNMLYIFTSSSRREWFPGYWPENQEGQICLVVRV